MNCLKNLSSEKEFPFVKLQSMGLMSKLTSTNAALGATYFSLIAPNSMFIVVALVSSIATQQQTSCFADISNRFDLFKESQGGLKAVCSEACNCDHAANLEVSENKLVQQLCTTVSFLMSEMKAFKAKYGKTAG